MSDSASFQPPSGPGYKCILEQDQSLLVLVGPRNLSSIFTFNLTERTWNRYQATGSFPMNLEGFTLSKTFENSVILFGGQNSETKKTSNRVYSLNFNELEWRRIETTTQQGHEIQARTVHTAVSFGNTIMFYGGRNSSGL